ncbi:MAG: putative toxin-antitoxin system toxin component, PIN family [Candidatus Hadarchaeum sp.]|jgi:putative PIN family toxin of toxin-antitoxin system|nr:putative toxin-antitoxin system toxin component, PIN family [Candidatus Hadarchaeum sp.]
MKSVKVVADTNVIVSALFWRGNESKIIDLVEKGKIKLFTSVALLDELKKVLGYERFGLGEKTVDDNVKYILTISEISSPKRRLKIIREDPADDKVLECALEGKVRYIVSGDMHLLRSRKFRGIRIIRAKELLSILNV